MFSPSRNQGQALVTPCNDALFSSGDFIHMLSPVFNSIKLDQTRFQRFQC